MISFAQYEDEIMVNQTVSLKGESFFKEAEEKRKQSIKELVIHRMLKDDLRGALIAFKQNVSRSIKESANRDKADSHLKMWIKHRGFNVFRSLHAQLKRVKRAERLRERNRL